MGLVHRGFGLTLGLGTESTYGTAVARDRWVRLFSSSLRRTRSKRTIPHLGSYGQVSTNERDYLIERDEVGGSVVLPISYDDASLSLVRFLLGGNATTGSGPYVHSMTLASPVNTSFTMELISGTPNGVSNQDTAEVFEGCVISRGSLVIEAGSQMIGTMDIIGETSGGSVAAGTPTYSSNGLPILHNHLGAVSLNSIDRPCRRITITVDRQLQRNFELGSLFTQQPIETRLMCEIEIETVWQQEVWTNEYYADTQNDLTATFTGTGGRQLALTAHNVLVMDESRPVSQAGEVIQTIRLKALADGTDQGLAFAVTNGNSAVTAN